MNYLSVVDKFFPDQPSGSARVAYDIACLMRDRGYAVTVFCRRQKPKDPDCSHCKGMQVVRFDYPQTVSLDPFKLQKQIALGTIAAKKYLLNTKWDIVHLHLAPHGSMVMNALGPDQNYVYTAHSPMVDEQLANWAIRGFAGKIKSLLGTGTLQKVEKKVLLQVKRIQTLSHFTKNILAQRYKLDDKITVIPHWCRPDFTRLHDKVQAREKLGWSAEMRVLFTVRRLAPRMGLDIAIQAVAPLLKQYPDMVFIIAGDGFLRQSLQQQAAALDTSGKIRFLGRVSDDVLKLCYEAADPSISFVSDIH